MADIGNSGFSRTKRFDQDELCEKFQNAKERTIGVDKPFLETQIDEKVEANALEAEKDRYYDQLANYFDKKLVMLEQEKKEIAKGMEQNLVKYRAEYQKKEQRREFDLSDPAYLKTNAPPRVGDEDPRNSISGCQKFEGEDLSAGERKKLQLKQQEQWCQQQMAEKAAVKSEQASNDSKYADLLRAQEMYQSKVAAEQDMARKNLQYTIAADNKALADEKRAKEANLMQATLSANQTEQANIISHDVYAENPAQALNYMAPHTRVRKDHWKGMSPEEVDYIQKVQATQREEMAARRMQEKEEQMRYDVQSENIRRTLEMKQQQVEDFKAEQRAAVKATLMSQAEEKVARDATLKQTYTNSAGTEFFAQFGKSGR